MADLNGPSLDCRKRIVLDRECRLVSLHAGVPELCCGTEHSSAARTTVFRVSHLPRARGHDSTNPAGSGRPRCHEPAAPNQREPEFRRPPFDAGVMDYYWFVVPRT